MSPQIDLTAAKPGVPVTLTFNHQYLFDECMNPTFVADGAVGGGGGAGRALRERDADYRLSVHGGRDRVRESAHGQPGYSQDTLHAFVPAIFISRPSSA